MLNPFPGRGPERRRQETGKSDGSIVNGHDSQIPFIVTEARRHSHQSKQAMEVRSSDFPGLYSDELARLR